MHCICADGGTLGKQDERQGDEQERGSSCTVSDTDSYSVGPMSLDRRSRRTLERDTDKATRRSSRARPRPIVDIDHGDQPITCSFSSTSSSGASALANHGCFTRRRQSLVEALSNPVPSTRSNSPVHPAGLSIAFCGRSATPVRASFRPSSSVTHGISGNRDTENRLYAMDEVIRCERDYVRLLSSLHEGFLKPACQHKELFDAHLVRAIFGNLHQLRYLHEKLLADLETAIAKSPICLGASFLHHVCTRPAFEAYSHYCNNHQRSCRRLSQLYEHDAYRKFFEDCRRICRLPTLRLDAFLLRPVQQLCRYPLLLGTLLERTPKAHHDHKVLSSALQAMEQLLTVVNNRRRLFEQLQELARWQKTVDDWKGPDLLQTSSRLVYNGELVCTCYAIGENIPRWRKRVSVFLFDRLLVLCSKDRSKKPLVFKSRFELDGANRSCLLSGGAWQLTAPSEGKRLLFKASSKQEAKLWLEALNKERLLVQQNARLPTNDEKLLALEMAKEPEP